MKKELIYIFIILLLIESNSVLTQQIYPDIITQNITIDELRQHLFLLASDSMEGRGTGTKGFDLAANYVELQFLNANLVKPFTKMNYDWSYYQPLSIDKYSIEKQTSIILKYYKSTDTFNIGSNFILFHFGNLKNEKIVGNIVNVGFGLSEPEHGIDDYYNKNVTGKWVLMQESISDSVRSILPASLNMLYSDIHMSSLKRARTAADKGAIGIIFSPSEIGMQYWNIRMKSFREYFLLADLGSPTRSADIPILLIDSLMFRSIVFFENNSQGYITLEKKFKKDNLYSRNIVGIVDGTDSTLKKQYLVIGAHLDHEGIKDGKIFYGADDNASGSTAILELAEAISLSPCKRSIIFALFTAEEIGLLGSYYFINNPPVEQNKIIAMINLDMIGRSDGNVNGIAPITPDIPGLEWKGIISRISDQSQIDWDYAESFPRKISMDHLPFYLMNIPSLFLFSGFHSDYHQPTDDADKIDYNFLHENTILVYKIIKQFDEQ